MHPRLPVAKPTDPRMSGDAGLPRGDCLRAILAEYDEMPCLSLTGPQAARLWNLAPREAEALLAKLVAAGFLRCNTTGRYVRAEPSWH